MRFTTWSRNKDQTPDRVISERTPSRARHFELGRRGEEMAIERLEREGYRIVAANFSIFNPPQANVDLHKRRQIARAARGYRRMLGLMSAPYRYDVVAVLLPADADDRSHVELFKNFWTDEKLRPRNWHENHWD